MLVGIKQRGQAIINGRWDWRTAAHELGHAFGLQHDFRDDSYIMSYGSGSKFLICRRSEVFGCESLYQSAVFHYKREQHHPFNFFLPRIIMYGVVTHISGRRTPPLSVPVQVRVSDTDGHSAGNTYL